MENFHLVLQELVSADRACSTWGAMRGAERMAAHHMAWYHLLTHPTKSGPVLITGILPLLPSWLACQAVSLWNRARLLANSVVVIRGNGRSLLYLCSFPIAFRNNLRSCLSFTKPFQLWAVLSLPKTVFVHYSN